ncbi:MAG: ROK family protein [Acidobacteriota bacterium]|nr:ROK family protein [Acidobacteriota bacterium]
MKEPEEQSNSSPNSDLVIAADLGGTNLRAATIDRQGQVHERTKHHTPKAEKPEEIVRAIVAAARECESRGLERGAKIRAVSVVVPGTVQVENGVVTKAPNVPSLNGFRLAAALESELQWPAVLENDANAAAVGEMWQGAGRGLKNIIMITLGTGVGGGIILDGRLLRGVDGSAGEVGHMGVEPFDGAPCTCGSRGCLEVYASATAIVRMTREMGARYPNSPLRASDQLTSAEVYKSGTEGDELALEVFRRMGLYLGVGLASLINILNPEMIIIGGGAAAGWDLFIPLVREQVAERAFPVPARRALIVRAERGDDAGILGAAHIAFEMMNAE